MTETTKSAIDLLYEAADIAAFTAADGWPVELTPKQLIALMVGHEWLPQFGKPRPVTIEHPDGTIEHLGNTFNHAAMETGTDRASKRAACRRIEKMLHDGGLVIEERSETIPQQPKRVLVLTGGTILKEQPPEIRRWAAVTKSAVRDCLSTIGKAPSECIRAWLGPEWNEAPGASKDPSKVESKKAKISAILAAIKEFDPEFSPDAMPGRKVDFFELCREVYPQEFKTVTQSTFNEYLPGLCKFGRGARQTDYYQNITPQIGVKYNKTA